ncbi:unnamed protein product [Auanema sp. JU1783]|nr:unnamed protein product [Auanema sp. JU1783]
MNLMELPNEILDMIITYLEPEEISNTCQVNKRLYHLVHKNSRIRRFPIKKLELLDVKEHVCIHIWTDVMRHGNKECATFCKTTHHSQLFHFIYLFKVHSLVIDGRSNKLRNALKSIPTWWLDSVKILNIKETQCDLDMLNFMRRLRNCPEVSIDPHYTINYISDVLLEMNSLKHLGLKNARTVLFDDNTLDVLVSLSNRSDTGLKSIEVSDAVTSITTNKLIEFLSTAKFAANCTMKFEGLDLEENELLKFLEEQGSLKASAADNYKFTLGDREITLSVGRKTDSSDSLSYNE